MLSSVNVYYSSFHGASVVAALVLANADTVSVLSQQSDTFKVDVSPVQVIAEAGGFTAYVTYKTVQFNTPVASSLLNLGQET